jgi:NADPH:quinone reductase-like Zn-dependent oxidoreductase
MKAIICPKYGPPEVLRIENIPKPVPKDEEILVKIIAAPVNSADVRVRGLAVNGFLKIIMRFVLGFSGPRKAILGTVFSGVVEDAGKNVSQFKSGDEVFGITGFKFGTHAEYISLKEKGNVTLKPANASHEEAAAIVFGGQSALYFLEKAKIKKLNNPKVLIIGAGSVGTAAIQIANYFGADVTVVCSSDGNRIVKSLGISNIINYDKEDFTKTSSTFDIIFDAAGKSTKKQCSNLLNKGGTYKTVEGLDAASETKEQLEFLKELFEQGAYKAVIDKTFPFTHAVEAHRYVDTGRKKGNVVLKIGEV